jgi:2Fe-2S type ferredoxin
VTVRPPRLPESTFECYEDELILDAALAQGVYLPFGCRMGSCGSCVGKLVAGEVVEGAEDVLSEAQQRDGYRLLCQSRPRSDLVILTERETDLGV